MRTTQGGCDPASSAIRKVVPEHCSLVWAISPKKARPSRLKGSSQFLGSGLLFVAGLFSAAAIAGAVLGSSHALPGQQVSGDVYCSARVSAPPKRVLTVLCASGTSGSAARKIPRVMSINSEKMSPAMAAARGGASGWFGGVDWIIRYSVSVAGLSRDTRGIACGVVPATRGQPMYFVIVRPQN